MSDNLLLDIKDGISQSERLPEMLLPGYFQVESREIPDFLNFIAGFAEHVTYYNFSNEPEGSWQEFFKSDETILIVIISRLDLSKQFDRYHKYIASVNTCDDENLPVLLKKLFDCIFDILGSLLALKFEFNQPQHSVESTEILLLVKDLEFEIARLKRYNQQAINFLGSSILSGENLHTSTPDPEDDLIFEGNTVKEKIISALPKITALFNYTRAKYNHLVKAAKNYLDKRTLAEQSYAPHISLLIAFLNLYQTHLRESINGITQRHLDFYYKELLGIASSKAQPDKVHLLFEPDAGINSMVLTSDEKLVALKPGKKEPLLYALEEDLYVTKAKIAELKTVFISDYTQIVSKDPQRENIREAQVYKNACTLFDPVAYQKKTVATTSWPILGEDQHNLSGNYRTMENAEMGLLIASPLFYQHEGERSITIKIHFKAESASDFKDYIKDYSATSGKIEESVLHQLLSNSLLIDYSAPEGWEDIEAYTIKLDENGSEHFVNIAFRLLPSAKPMDLYQQVIHGQSYESKFPIVRLMINNYAPHNPYSFLRDTVIERVSITVNVKNFSGIKLHNNISMLSAANPFQPFGPQPSVGSFLDIKNTNVFNRYTSDFCVNIEWLDLPRDEGGFETYYQGYQGNITNDSFKAGLSAVSGGQFKPEPASQQQYNLFATETSKNTLKNKTTFSNADFKKIEFLNEPGLAAEDLISNASFKEGAVRFELLSPAEAFGHKQFPKLFPETVMNNAKFFKKKVPLPNQPYIPVIKTISVDFTLEHSENFKDASNEFQNNLILIHQYPFGYQTIYPNSSRKNYYLMPQFDKESNLYIGLKDVEPHQELSILFQLEEKNFHHTFHEPDLICWSYLVNNSWQNLDTLNILIDATNNFVNTGIIKLKLPDDVSPGNTILNPDLFWIRASVNKSSGTQSKVIALCINAATVVRIADGTIESEVDFNLPPGCITGFSRTVKGIENVKQLFSSFNGKPHETQEKYYVRVSERLRHKNRLVQSKDVMQVILEEFPQILMVKCFGTGLHNAPILPGVNMQVVLVPKEMENGRFLSDQPKVNLATLYQVKSFLSKLISPFVNMEVGNPVYEKVKVVCSVMFAETKAADNGFYIKKLTDDINRNIAPWLYENNSEIKIGAKLFKSDLFMFIKNLPYVTYITGFSAVHFFNAHTEDSILMDAEINDTAVDRDLDYISGSSASAILIPSASHLITVLDKTGYQPPAPTGINGFTIGEELLVTARYDIEKENTVHHHDAHEDFETFNLIIPHDIE